MLLSVGGGDNDVDNDVIGFINAVDDRAAIIWIWNVLENRITIRIKHKKIKKRKQQRTKNKEQRTKNKSNKINRDIQIKMTKKILYQCIVGLAQPPT